MNYGKRRDQFREDEKEFIVRLVNDPSLMNECYGLINLTDLEGSKSSELYDLMRKSHENHEEWSIITLRSSLKDPTGYGEILFAIPQTVGLSQFRVLTKNLKKEAVRRKLFWFFESKMNHTFEEEPSFIVSDSLSFLSNIDTLSKKNQSQSIESLVSRHKELMEQRYSGEAIGIPSGFDELDYLLGQGLQRKDLIIVGARPSVGKTSFTLSVCYNAAKKGSKVLFVSVEMDDQEIMDRLLSFETGQPTTSIIRGTADKEELEKGYQSISKLPLTILYLPKTTTGELYSLASRLKYSRGLDLLCIDYLGILADAGDDEVLRLGRISSSLKTIANLLDCAVLAPHQLNRNIEKRSEGKKDLPVLSDLRDSGHIEQDADVVMFLNRDLLGTRSERATLRIAKNRTGETGIFDLKFNTSTTKFQSDEH